MWSIIPVKQYHTQRGAGNRQAFRQLAAGAQTPPGLLAYEGADPVGWCAVGPRARYVRAIRTPTYIGRDEAEDPLVWLVPCFFIRKDRRSRGVARALLEEAVALAAAHGAAAIEGFPLAGPGRRSGPDMQVGVEALFAACGFSVLRRPTANRVVMRREL